MLCTQTAETLQLLCSASVSVLCSLALSWSSREGLSDSSYARGRSGVRGRAQTRSGSKTISCFLSQFNLCVCVCFRIQRLLDTGCWCISPSKGPTLTDKRQAYSLSGMTQGSEIKPEYKSSQWQSGAVRRQLWQLVLHNPVRWHRSYVECSDWHCAPITWVPWFSLAHCALTIQALFVFVHFSFLPAWTHFHFHTCISAFITISNPNFKQTQSSGSLLLSSSIIKIKNNQLRAH